MKNSDSYVATTNKQFNTFTMCENTEEHLMSGSEPVRCPPVNTRKTGFSYKRKIIHAGHVE